MSLIAKLIGGGSRRRAERLKDRFRFALIEGDPGAAPLEQARDAARQLLVTGDFATLGNWLGDELARKTSAPNLGRIYEAILAGIYTPLAEPAAADGVPGDPLAPYRAWYEESTEDAGIGAILARACQLEARQRGGKDDTARALLDEAEAVMASHATSGTDNPLWHRTRLLEMVETGADDTTLDTRFERSLAFDPYNVATYRTRATSLMASPDGGPDALDAFARQSAERTADHYGAGLYADIHLALDPPDGPPGPPPLNWPLMRRGLEDLIRLNPGQVAVNALVRAAHRAGDHETVRRVFDRQISAISLLVWRDEIAAYEALAAAGVD